MCTVTYLPTRNGFILTHNRDEAPGRSPKNIASRTLPNGTLLYWPPDTQAGGAWIGANDRGLCACLLNGAFVKHKHLPPYRRSRGLILIDFFEQNNPESFFQNIELHQIEPFTLLSFEPTQCFELRWDGHEKHFKSLETRDSHFWCSATLYSPELQKLRETVFRNWEKEQPESPELAKAILELHHHGSIGDPENNYVMNRQNRVQTVSITQIERKEHHIHIRYEDLLEGQTDIRTFGLPDPI